MPFSARDRVYHPPNPTGHSPAVPLRLPIRSWVIGGDASYNHPIRGTVSLKVRFKFGPQVSPYPLRHPEPADHVFVEPGGYGGGLQVRDNSSFNPLAERVNGYDYVARSVGLGGLHRTYCI